MLKILTIVFTDTYAHMIFQKAAASLLTFVVTFTQSSRGSSRLGSEMDSTAEPRPVQLLFPSLSMLDASFTGLTTLPPELSEQGQLTELKLCNNRLKEVLRGRNYHSMSSFIFHPHHSSSTYSSECGRGTLSFLKQLHSDLT